MESVTFVRLDMVGMWSEKFSGDATKLISVNTLVTCDAHLKKLQSGIFSAYANASLHSSKSIELFLW